MPNSFRSIGLIARATAVMGNQLFTSDDLQNSQFIYLMRIVETPGITQTQLANQLHVDPSTCLRTVRKLIAHQYVARQTDEHNKKQRPLVATAQGQALYPELQAYEQHILAIGTHGLSAGERLILEELLGKVANNIQEYQATQSE
ncbi:MarR family winged helix-turn-helix transcriptional regulator [Levilactobacillus tujiorum]|uniref:MarR family winged helix-turn-helix transcriptional regulator n=1 Tax=Levilactobacillus tujiorum TaxID=2912243 RepID=UPI001457651D|nr:MarR family winged helix-turn-helix transcriptional regulator [Levilactobacillus tujiorum]NLR32550.1 winged helix-turn-helix transcriptional regulator [Levilactobacillus tujiorum]